MSNQKYGSDINISFRKATRQDSSLLNKFDCGNDSINQYIYNDSLKYGKDVPYIFIDDDTGNVIAFCSIGCNGISVIKQDLEGFLYNTSLHAIEIDFYAVNIHYQNMPYEKTSGQHETLSQALFSFMLDYVAKIAREYVGATHCCLYSVPEAVTFYQRCGFINFQSFMMRDQEPYTIDCVPMFMKL